MRIANPTALASVAARRARGSRDEQRPERRSLRRRVSDYTLWAFNPQRELSSRYDRAA